MWSSAKHVQSRLCDILNPCVVSHGKWNQPFLISPDDYQWDYVVCPPWEVDIERVAERPWTMQIVKIEDIRLGEELGIIQKNTCYCTIQNIVCSW